jgi:hypothetical protein
MTIEMVFLLIALWILFGLLDAWVLYARGYSGWRWTMICVLTGPLAVSVLYDQIHGDAAGDEPDGPSLPDAPEGLGPQLDDEGEPIADAVGQWPRDDPEGPFFLQGYRGLADH